MNWQTIMKRLLASLICAALGVTCTAIQASTILKFNHTDTPTGSRHGAAELFAKRISELSGGDLRVIVFHSGQLGNDPKSVEALRSGQLDFTVSATGSFASLNPALNLSLLPYLVETYEQGWALYDKSKWFNTEFGKLPGKGVRILATWESGFRSFTTKEAFGPLAQLKGKPMRVFPNAMIQSIIGALGFEPKVLPVTEVYLALQRGTIFGQENPVDTIYSQRFYEVAPFITLTQHVYSPIPLAISEKTWSRLSEAQRGVITRAANDAASFSRAEVVRNEQKQLSAMAERGARVTRIDIKPLQDALKPVYEKAQTEYGLAATDLMAEAQRIRSGQSKP
jgi:TRAP-type transport system periplasmic protein